MVPCRFGYAGLTAGEDPKLWKYMRLMGGIYHAVAFFTADRCIFAF